MHSSRMRTGRSLIVCWSLLPGGGSAPGWGVVSQHALRQTPPREQNDIQVQKYYLGHNFVAAGKYIITGLFLNWCESLNNSIVTGSAL